MSSQAASVPGPSVVRSNRPEAPEAPPAGRRRLLPATFAALVLLLGWLAATAPLARALDPPVPAGLTLLAADGTPIARRGAHVGAPVAFDELPGHVWQPFLAIEDRRFFRHAGVDAIGLARAGWRNLVAGEVREGGSTITQQLAKSAFRDPKRTVGHKLRELVVAFWLELRLSKREILSRYLSTAYFGNDVYGLTAAADYYFGVEPRALRVEQAAMLAGLVKAPSRLNPVADPQAAAARTRVVLTALARDGALPRERAAALAVPAPQPRARRAPPAGTYFADWVFPEARLGQGEANGSATLQTTLETRLQRQAVAAIGRARLGDAQVALVAMRPDGRVVAMVGGRSYRLSPFNRATMARRQPGSTFKLFTYLAAIRAGWTPDSLVDDWPVAVDGWAPANADGRYRGLIPLREAARVSSNAAAVRLAEQVGRARVVEAARDLGISAELEPGPAMTLGTSGVSLIEMTAAYAAIAAGRYPVVPYGLPREGVAAPPPRGFLDARTRPAMLDLLYGSANAGTGRSAALRVPTFGKTGTSQDNRDAWFIGFAGDLVTGVWVGNDDNSSLGSVAGGGLPARIWADFMARALGTSALPAPREVRASAEPPRRARAARPERRGRWWRERERGRDRWERWFERERERDRRRGRGNRRGRDRD